MFKQVSENDLEDLSNYIKKYYKNSILSNKNFLSYEFKLIKKYNIYILKFYNKIKGFNFVIKKIFLYKGLKHKLIWTSAAQISEKKYNFFFGLLIFDIHRKYPLVGAFSPNINSKKINDLIFKYKYELQRYVLLLNSHNKINGNELKYLFKKNLSKKLNKNLTIQCSSKAKKKYETVTKNFAKNFDLIINKNLKYLINRYDNNNFIEYRYLEIYKSKKLISVFVFRKQIYKSKIYYRVVDFFSSNLNFNSWPILINYLISNNVTYVDFFVVGNIQNNSLIKAGFFKDKSITKHIIPNLLSPISYRKWDPFFYIGGSALFKKISPKKIWLTKSDGDRDWPNKIL